MMRVLVVENEPELLESICRVLRAEGYAVCPAGNGQVGLYYALNCDYDAIILDAMLPYLDGWAVLERLRSSKPTPVLMLTAQDQPRSKEPGLQADDHLVKPFDLKELPAHLGAIIRRRAQESRQVIDPGAVTATDADVGSKSEANHHPVYFINWAKYVVSGGK
jgi:DNA-binding response OmpR family regulator